MTNRHVDAAIRALRQADAETRHRAEYATLWMLVHLVARNDLRNAARLAYDLQAWDVQRKSER